MLRAWLARASLPATPGPNAGAPVRPSLAQRPAIQPGLAALATDGDRGSPARPARVSLPARPSGDAARTAPPASTLARAAPPARPSQPARAAATSPLPLSAFPRPAGDNGRGLHWIPTTASPPAVVDRYVAEAKALGVTWVVFLNDGTNVGANDYLVTQLKAAGIEPVMRIYTRAGAPIAGDLEGMVRRYVVLGVRYFQPYNEPNLRVENPDGVPSVERYVDNWLRAARAIVRGGGLPGFGALAPGGDLDDREFLRQALQSLRRRGELAALDRAWLSSHNYTLNVPVDAEQAAVDGSGFWRFRAYSRILRQELGRDLPIIGTEGGTFVGDRQDPAWPTVSEPAAIESVKRAYRYMRDEREPWNFAYSYWVIANEAGGGSDPTFSRQALFRADGSASPIVGVLKGLG